MAGALKIASLQFNCNIKAFTVYIFFFCFILSDRMAKSVPSLIGSQPDPSEDHEPTAANEP
jgi:hypothetical protein